MVQHLHREDVEGCFRCDLSREEVREYIESTPDTDEVRDAFTDEAMSVDVEAARFNRWYAAELRKAKAEAWEEGRMAVWVLHNSAGLHHFQEMTNPYREDQP